MFPFRVICGIYNFKVILSLQTAGGIFDEKPFEPQYQDEFSPYSSPYISYGISWE